MEFEPILSPGVNIKRPLVVAGPCSAETEVQVLTTAHALVKNGVKIFRAGIWKPRTKPGSFEGVGTKGLIWLNKVKQETGMYVATEVATPTHVREALTANIDILWIGSRTAANPFAMQELADALKGKDVPVLIKNPINPDIELWIGGIERLYNAGLHRLAAIHRGFSTYDNTPYRNAPQWRIPIELHRRLPNLPLLCDPSHIGGKRDLISSICQQAMDLNFDGLMIESHCQPKQAWSDAEQQLTPNALCTILSTLIIRDAPTTDVIEPLRRRIDELDEDLLRLLVKRMEISKSIGIYKREHGMPILQSARYNDLLNRRIQQASKIGLNEICIKAIWEAIHEESIRQQLEIMRQ